MLKRPSAAVPALTAAAAAAAGVAMEMVAMAKEEATTRGNALLWCC
jgi:uncharacterized membrane protein AbrB (regulator of aidB expression)